MSLLALPDEEEPSCLQNSISLLTSADPNLHPCQFDITYTIASTGLSCLDKVANKVNKKPRDVVSSS